jgi:hypothetical protein
MTLLEQIMSIPDRNIEYIGIAVYERAGSKYNPNFPDKIDEVHIFNIPSTSYRVEIYKQMENLGFSFAGEINNMSTFLRNSPF